MLKKITAQKFLIKKTLFSLFLLIFVSISTFVLADTFSGPVSNPPLDNAPVPINETASAQAKLGGLSLGGDFYAAGTGEFGSRLGVGALSADYDLNISNAAHAQVMIDGGESNYSILRFASSTGPWIMGGGSSYSGYGGISALSLYSPTTIWFRAGTEERMRITSDGNVGIGITSPSFKLDVAGVIRGQASSGSGDVLRVGNDSKLVDIDIAHTMGLYSITDPTRGSLKLGSGGPTITGLSGNVGIGTTNPAVKLDVSGTNVNGKSLQLRSGDAATGTDSAQIIFSYNGNSYNSSGYAHSIRSRHNGGAEAGNAIDFWLWDHGADTASTLGSKRVMTIDGTGQVGIGVSNPSYTLDVVGNINFTGDLYKNGVLFGGGNLWTESGSNIYRNTGNVGIGTTNPTQKLTVTGTSWFKANETGGFGTSIALGRSNTGNSPAYYFKTDDVGGDILEIYSMRWGGNTYFTRSSNNGDQTMVRVGGDDSSHFIDLYDSTTETVNIKLDSNGNSYFNGGNVGIGAINPAEQLHVAGIGRFDNGIQVDGSTVIDNGAGWHRSYGGTGWYNATYGGGWYMTDTTWIRAYNNKRVYVQNIIRADGGFQVDERTMISSTGATHNAQYIDDTHYGYFEVRNDSGDRGAYFGWGNGSSAVNLALDNASKLDITGGEVVMSGNLTTGGLNKSTNGFLADSLGTAYGQFIATAGNYGFILRNDSANTYFLLTNSGDPLGAWNSLRPFMISNNTGNVYMANNQVIVDHAAGSITANSFLYPSDRRLKESIKTLSNSLERISKLEGVSFNWRKNGQRSIGFIAQDMEKVLPELVSTNNEGYKAVQYGNITALLVEGVKELKKENEELRAENQMILERLEKLEKRL